MFKTRIISKLNILALIICVAILMTTCSFPGFGQVTLTSTITGFGTVISFKLTGPNRKTVEKVIQELTDETNRLDAMLSTSKENSELSLLNQTAYLNSVKVSDELFSIIDTSVGYCETTNGLLDITIGKLINLWGIDKGNQTPPNSQSINELMMDKGYQKIQMNDVDHTIYFADERISIHLGAVAKGYLSNQLKNILLNSSCFGVLNLGGSILAVNSQDCDDAYNVAIADPGHPTSIKGYLSIHNNSLVTSGDYQRYFEFEGIRYHHIINPITGNPSQSDLASISIIGEDAFLCDALSTACFIMGSETAIAFLKEHYPNYQFVAILQDGHVLSSDDLSFTVKAS